MDTEQLARALYAVRDGTSTEAVQRNLAEWGVTVRLAATGAIGSSQVVNVWQERARVVNKLVAN